MSEATLFKRLQELEDLAISKEANDQKIKVVHEFLDAVLNHLISGRIVIHWDEFPGEKPQGLTLDSIPWQERALAERKKYLEDKRKEFEEFIKEDEQRMKGIEQSIAYGRHYIHMLNKGGKNE